MTSPDQHGIGFEVEEEEPGEGLFGTDDLSEAEKEALVESALQQVGCFARSIGGAAWRGGIIWACRAVGLLVGVL